MRPGRMDRRVVIQQPTATKDDWNYDTIAWTTFATVWATKLDKGVAETVEASRQTAVNRTQFNIRYLSGVNATMRISYGGLFYYIVGVEELGRREGQILYTELRN
jgi:SPP1 family predicted phage head-tail adaptor